MVKSGSFIFSTDKTIITCGSNEKNVQSFGWQSSVNVRFEDMGVNGTMRESQLKTLKINTQLYYNI